MGSRWERQIVIDAKVNYQSWETRTFLRRCCLTEPFLPFWLLPVFSIRFIHTYVSPSAKHTRERTHSTKPWAGPCFRCVDACRVRGQGRY